jgi:hypothetical protein
MFGEKRSDKKEDEAAHPRIAISGETRQIHGMKVNVSKALLDDIAAETKRRGMTKKQIIDERLKKPAKPSLWDRMKHLVIDDPNSPGDLSTNKKRMEGYGRSRSR